MVLLLSNLNALTGGLFLIAAFGIVVTRQVRACLNFFVFSSISLAASALLLGAEQFSWHLVAVGVINLITKPWLLPWILRRTVREEIYNQREITQAVNIPTSLLIALGLVIAAYFFSLPWLDAVAAGVTLRTNVPAGLAGLLLGAYTITARREAVPQLLGLLTMENGAFFAGIAIAAELPLIAELALAFDVLILTFIVAVLTRTIHEHIGTTAAGALSELREETRQ